jgi:hypothetical protein
MQTGSIMGESSQKPIKIDKILWDELDEWLKTPVAKTLGFHSKAQFVTQAVRELLGKYSNRSISVSEEVYAKFYKTFQAEREGLQRLGINNFSDYVTFNLEQMMQRDETIRKHLPRLEHIEINDNSIVIKDNVKNKIAEVVVKKGELFCNLCKEKNCVHVGYVFSLPEIYTVLNNRLKKGRVKIK